MKKNGISLLNLKINLGIVLTFLIIPSFAVTTITIPTVNITALTSMVITLQGNVKSLEGSINALNAQFKAFAATAMSQNTSACASTNASTSTSTNSSISAAQQQVLQKSLSDLQESLAVFGKQFTQISSFIQSVERPLTALQQFFGSQPSQTLASLLQQMQSIQNTLSGQSANTSAAAGQQETQQQTLQQQTQQMQQAIQQQNAIMLQQAQQLRILQETTRRNFLELRNDLSGKNRRAKENLQRIIPNTYEE